MKLLSDMLLRFKGETKRAREVMKEITGKT